jgi:hypothetical protein
MMEDEGDQVRSLRLSVEDKPVGEELGKKQALGEWNRFGPYLAVVKDGSLDLLLSADAKMQSQDPHLSGIAVYRMVGSAPGAKPTPAGPDDAQPKDAPPEDAPPKDAPPEDAPLEDGLPENEESPTDSPEEPPAE